MTISKSQAQAMVLERSRALPAAERQTYALAIVFAAKLTPSSTSKRGGDSPKIIQGWLVREINGVPTTGSAPVPPRGPC